MKRSARLETYTPLRRGEPLRATKWGTRPAKKVENWRKDFMPEHVTKEKGPKYTAFEIAWFKYVRTLPCSASHLTLSADQKGMGMKVPHDQAGPLCLRHHDFWDGRAGRTDNPFDGMTKDERYELALEWLKPVHEAATPGDDRDHADELERLGLGKVIGNGRDSWSWLPGYLVEASAETLLAAAGRLVTP